MDPQAPTTNEVVDQLWADKREIKKKKRRMRPIIKEELIITSLMDAFTIILCFLLKTFGSDPIQIKESDEMRLPSSVSEMPLKPAATVAITANSVLVDDVKVLDLRHGAVDESYKRDGQDGLYITPLYDALHEAVQKQKAIAARNPAVPFQGLLMVLGHRETNYRLITEVLYTAGQAEFDKFKFVVVSTKAK